MDKEHKNETVGERPRREIQRMEMSKFIITILSALLGAALGGWVSGYMTIQSATRQITYAQTRRALDLRYETATELAERGRQIVAQQEAYRVKNSNESPNWDLSRLTEQDLEPIEVRAALDQVKWNDRKWELQLISSGIPRRIWMVRGRIEGQALSYNIKDSGLDARYFRNHSYPVFLSSKACFDLIAWLNDYGWAYSNGIIQIEDTELAWANLIALTGADRTNVFSTQLTPQANAFISAFREYNKDRVEFLSEEDL